VAAVAPRLDVAAAKYFSFWIKVKEAPALNTHWRSDNSSWGNIYWNPAIGVPIIKYNRDF